MRLIGVTGPSSFTVEVLRMVEEFFGANPVLLYQDREDNLKYWVNRVDAVILSGGLDLHPMTYNRSYPAKKNMRSFDLRRDHRECKVIDQCIEARVPILGICRGHQLLGVYRKKYPMISDLSEESNILHCPSIQEPKFTPDPYMPVHKVQVLVDRNLFGRATGAGPEDLWVNSFHHQGLLWDQDAAKDPNVIGTGFVTKDKAIIELMECPEDQWLSCQWHPEYDYKEQESSRRFLQYFKDQYLAVSA